jgi:hypothetical protein
MEDKLKRVITVACLCLGLAAPSALATSGNGNANGADNGTKNGGKSDIAKECAALKKADKAAFKATYGPKHAMRHCKKGEEPDAVETTPAEFKNAAKECRAEREADAAAFQDAYGSNKNKKNAFGKCVSSKVGDDDDEGGETV